jgi:hypothetical protein
MEKTTWHKPKAVLVFNRRKVLTLIASSVNESAKFSGLRPGNISKACTGGLISNGKYYFRYIDPEVEVELADVGTLKLEEYDQLCGIERPVYATMKMNRKKWKYNKNN